MKEYMVIEDNADIFDTFKHKTSSLRRAEKLICALKDDGHEPVLYVREVTAWKAINTSNEYREKAKEDLEKKTGLVDTGSLKDKNK